MNNPFRYFKNSPEVIRITVLMYVRYPLSLHHVEDLLFERGIDISYETIRYWWNRFGPIFARAIREKRNSAYQYSNWRWHLDEVFVKVGGETRYLWRAVDHEGEVLDAIVTRRRDRKAALRLLKKLMKKYGRPNSIITDRLGSYLAAMKELGCLSKQETGRWMNNRVENSHLVFRKRERAMNKFRDETTLQKFVSVQSQVQNHFNGERHLNNRQLYRQFRSAALAEWQSLAA